AFKPHASIAQEQKTIECVTHENATLVIKGRHDACIAVRAQPVVEAAVSIALLDAMLSQGEVACHG
uniref:chorismate synthase n=1 Tax=Candidatus Fimivicinus sp. TaxID=3056640 RepID=UPI003FEFFC4B